MLLLPNQREEVADENVEPASTENEWGITIEDDSSAQLSNPVEQTVQPAQYVEMEKNEQSLEDLMAQM